MRGLRLLRACVLALALVAMLALSGTALAATFTVDSVEDAVDANPGDGICAIDTDDEPACTLRAAIQETNALSGADSIVLPAGTYPLDLFAHDGTSDSGPEAGDLDIRDDLTLTGAGAATTIIDGQGSEADEAEADPERVIDIEADVVAISGVTVQNGEWRNNGGGVRVDNPSTLTMSDSIVRDNLSGEDGGGFYIHSASALILRRVTVSGNRAYFGGGIYNNSDGPEPDGEEADPGPGLLIEDSTIADNVADESEGGGYGGGIFNDDEATIVRSHVDDNRADNAGGGIYNDLDTTRGDELGQLLIVDSTVDDNRAVRRGGAIYNDGLLVMTRSTVADNRAEIAGGGIYNGGAGQNVTANAVVTDSTLSGNWALDLGEGGGGEGGAIWNEGLFRLERSTVSGNGFVTVEGDLLQTARGGGIHNADGGVFFLPDQTATRATVTVVNSTVSGNRADDGGGVYNEGVTVLVPSIAAEDEPVPTVSLTHVTLTGNLSNLFGSEEITEGAGIANEPGEDDGEAVLRLAGLVELTNTIVSANVATIVEDVVVAAAVTVANCGGEHPASKGRNLEDANTCGLNSTTGDGDLVGVDPKLGPLAANGGPTQTHALLDGSPALDAAGTSGFPPTDQRGTSRPQGPAADIGAYERVFVAPPPPPPPPAPPAPPPPPPPPPAPPVIREPAQPAPRCRIPNVKGRTLPQARAAIVRAGCRVGALGQRTSRTTKGLVLAQSPGPGNRVRLGFRVNLVLSKGVRAVRAVRAAPPPRFTG